METLQAEILHGGQGTGRHIGQSKSCGKAVSPDETHSSISNLKLLIMYHSPWSSGPPFYRWMLLAEGPFVSLFRLSHLGSEIGEGQNARGCSVAFIISD